ncbi:MAG: carboxypeptidase regulatory-like domain-containing protein [Bacteroidales bacterium]|nr:carboxypeptidase regulatory-like domain-containing protein [Bacteroidales bacterium]
MKKILFTLLLLAGWMASSYAAYTPYRPEVPARNKGERKILVLLYNAPGVSSFSADYQECWDMFNQEGYHTDPGYGYNYMYGHGSITEYFVHNSSGKWHPQFDVYGPVTLTKESYEYSGEKIAEICTALGGQLNVADYDTDGDGDIDCIICIDVAQGASRDTYLSEIEGDYSVGGKKISRAIFCDNVKLIGFYCHWLAIYLGVPNFSDMAGNANPGWPDQFQVTGTGFRNWGGNCPPYFSSLERYMVGWIDSFDVIDKPGSYILPAICDNASYMIESPTPGLFYLVEYREKYKWDEHLNSNGLIVFRVDQSKARFIDGVAADTWWKTREYINWNNSGYLPYNIVRTSSDETLWALPNSEGVNELALVDGDGNYFGITLRDIGNNGAGQAFFRTVFEYSFHGQVKDSGGKLMSGVTVKLTLQDGTVLTAVTDASGKYAFSLDDSVLGTVAEISISHSGYLPVFNQVEINAADTKCDLSIRQTGGDVAHNLQKYDENGAGTRYGFAGQYGGTAAMRYMASELSSAGLVGARLTSISFYVGYTNSKGYTSNFYAVVYFGKEPVLVKDVTDIYSGSDWVTVDVTADNIVIPSGKDVYIGFGLKSNCPADHGWWPSAYSYKGDADHGGGYYVNDIVGEQITWGTHTSYEFAIKATALAPSQGATPSDFGIAWIEFTSEGYLEIHPAAGKTVKDEVWDDSDDRIWTCTLTYTDGTTETVFFDISPYDE